MFLIALGIFIYLLEYSARLLSRVFSYNSREEKFPRGFRKKHHNIGFIQIIMFNVSQYCFKPILNVLTMNYDWFFFLNQTTGLIGN